jgi:hypothetical protein
MHVQEHAVSLDGLNELEVVEMSEHRWWSIWDILSATGTERFAPRRLAELLPRLIAGDIPSHPIETGT